MRTEFRCYSPAHRQSLKDLSENQKRSTERAERIGVPLAFVILVLAFGAVVPALLPLLLAIAGLLLTQGVLAILVLMFNFDTLLMAIVTMIGLEIGIDYSLFIVSRFREELLVRLGNAIRAPGGAMSVNE